MEIHGKVVSGVGEGKWYVEKYLPYFEQKLGLTCHPGTLNLKVEKPITYEGYQKITIEPVEEGFVIVDCYLVLINGQYDGAIVIPHKTAHDASIIEVISPLPLREELKLKDGDEVVVELV